MMTPDKDFGQLVTDHVKVYHPARKGGDPEVQGVEEIKAKYGFESPLQVIDMLALMGKVILVIILLSAALAFVVLYNLTNINITDCTMTAQTGIDLRNSQDITFKNVKCFPKTGDAVSTWKVKNFTNE